MAFEEENFVSEVTTRHEAPVPASSGGSDGAILPITGHKLNGLNYLQWSQSVKMFVCGRGKEDYLTGDAAPLTKEDPKFKVWKSESNMVDQFYDQQCRREFHPL